MIPAAFFAGDHEQHTMAAVETATEAVATTAVGGVTTPATETLPTNRSLKSACRWLVSSRQAQPRPTLRHGRHGGARDTDVLLFGTASCTPETANGTA